MPKVAAKRIARKPKLGQHFLTDDAAAHRIIDALGDVSHGTVLEIGPGRGVLTSILAKRARRLIAIELDRVLAAQLRMKFALYPNVEVIEGDATDTGLEVNRFSAVMCFSVLHHMPTAGDQDRLFFEVGRVLRPGGIFVGVDGRDLEPIRASHAGDTFNPVPPGTLPGRLQATGLADVRVDTDDYQIRFVASKPGVVGST